MKKRVLIKIYKEIKNAKNESKKDWNKHPAHYIGLKEAMEIIEEVSRKEGIKHEWN